MVVLTRGSACLWSDGGPCTICRAQVEACTLASPPTSGWQGAQTAPILAHQSLFELGFSQG